jgi:hypothetical protein
MADTTVTNGSVPSVSELTPEKAKALHTQLNKFYRQRSGEKKKSKPLLKPIGDINLIDLKLKIQKSPMDFDDLKNGMPFALDPLGTVLFTKTGRERAICLNTMQPQSVGGASVYRVFL